MIYPNSNVLKIFILAFAIGFFVGRIFSSKPLKFLTKTEEHEVLEQKQQISTQAEEKKDSTTSLQTIVENKLYSPNGKLKSETITTTKRVSTAQISKKLDQVDNIQTDEIRDLKTTTEKSYAHDWLVGVSVPVIDITNPNTFKVKDIKGIVAYRVVGEAFVFVASDIEVQTAELGILFPL